MNPTRRILTILACALVVSGVAAAPASAHSADFTSHQPNGFLRYVECPHPTLISPFGPLSLCTTGTTGVLEDRDIGWYSPLTNEWVDLYRNADFAGSETVQKFGLIATDGIRGTFRGGFPVIGGFGKVSYGIQYTVYGGPVGRFGNYSFTTGKFHPDPNRPWYEAEHSI